MFLLKKEPLQIINFRSYGTNSYFYLRGRALEDESIDLEQKSWFNLLLNTWKRLESDEIKYANVEIKLPNGELLKTQTDNHGYFKTSDNFNELQNFTNKEGWLEVEVSYSNATINRKIQSENIFLAEILIPSNTAEYGVISDIDDTILHTGVVSTLKWRLLYNTFFKSAKERLAIEGAAVFYNLLHKGESGKNTNPIFYVSHSPWNLYLYLELFLKQHDFPKGPVLLRSFKTILKRKVAGEYSQKQKEIINILKVYPKLSFILIGDSGEHDIDIYIDIAKNNPNRIKAIYLRSVNHKKKMMRVKRVLENYNSTPILLVERTDQAIVHAKAHNFII